MSDINIKSADAARLALAEEELRRLLLVWSLADVRHYRARARAERIDEEAP